jgi:hypothetical protein
MQDYNSTLPAPKSIRIAWNKGKLIGAKPPLMARHVWSIRTRLQPSRRGGLAQVSDVSWSHDENASAAARR